MKNKILIFAISLLFFIPISANALSENYTDIVSKYTNVEVDSNKVSLYLFYGRECPHCEEEREWLEQFSDVPIEEIYGESKVKQYRKKPVVISAYQATEDEYIDTLEGTMKANKGDFVITGVEGETYPCKRDIFWKTYEEVK
jgi:thiol-disulfide isomerase/thioredoxin